MGRFTLSAAGLAVALSFGIGQSGATPFAPAQGLGNAAGELGLVETIHCRPYAHHYPNRWRRANGCPRLYRHGVVVVPGRRFIYRDGVRVRIGTGSRYGGSRTTIRSGGSTTVRSGGSTTIRSGGDTTVRTRDGANVRGSGGANVRGSGGADVRSGGGGATVGGSGGANVQSGGGSSRPAGGAATTGGSGSPQKPGAQ
jgi:hypothetical protein